MKLLEHVIPKLFVRKEMQDIRPGVHRVKEVLNAVGFSQHMLGTVIHIAGTNGKGSTARMLSTVLSQTTSTGLFTSPHLISVTERIQVSNVPISEEDFVRLYKKIEHFDMSFFESVTVIAFLYFAEKQVCYTVLEVGMGGRLDATNCIDAPISVITSVGLDHQKWLGDTAQEIAAEKAGIIKQQATVFISESNRYLEDVFDACCVSANARINWVGETLYPLSLLGAHQKQNAGLVQAVCEHLGISSELIQKGLTSTQWNGRLQWIADNILLDGAHNADGFYALSQYLSTVNKSIVVLFGTSQGRTDEVLKLLSPKRVYFTCAHSNATSLEVFTSPGIGIRDYKQAYRLAVSSLDETEILVVTGSLYLVGDILALHTATKQRVIA